MMNKKLTIVCLSVTAALTLAFVLPIPIWNAQFEGIDGYYQAGWCACPGEIFDEYRDGKWYTTGHGDHGRQIVGEVEAGDNLWRVSKGTQLVWTVVIRDGETVFKSAKTELEWRVDRVRNPWRIWLPSVFEKEPRHNTAPGTYFRKSNTTS